MSSRAAGKGFSREAVVWQERVGIRTARNVPDEMPERLGRAPIKPAAVGVENHRTGQSFSWLAPPASYRANRIMREVYTIGRDHPSHDRVERNSSGDAAQFPFVWLYHGPHLVHDDPIPGGHGVNCRPRFACGHGLIGGGLHLLTPPVAR